MAVDWNKFDNAVNKQQLEKDIKEAKENGGTGDFPEVPSGTYTVKLKSMEMGVTGPKSKNPGSPILKASFKIKEGKYKGQLLFYNRVLYGTKNDGNMIASALGFLEKLEPSEEVGQIAFHSYGDFADLVLDVFEDVTDALEYEVEYDPDAFNTISIKEAFEV